MDFNQLLKNVQLMSCIQSGDLAEVTDLLNDGADVNFVHLHGRHETPLHLAVLSGDPNLVELLLDRGANPELQNVDLKKPKDLCSSLDDQKKYAIEAVFGRYFKRDRSVGSDREEQPGTESTAKTFVKRPGTAAVGQFYETKMLTMVLFRLLHDDRVGGFYLGNNLDEAGAFDDIVLRVKDAGGGGRSRVYCLQAKHKKPEHVINFEDLVNMKDKKGDFNLGKYFESYLQIRYTFDPAGDHAIFGGEFEQTELELIIFTPAVISSFDEKLVEVTKRDNLFYTDKMGKIIEISCTKKLEDLFEKKSEEWHRKTIAEILVKLISIEKYDTIRLKEAIEKLEMENVLGKLTNKSVEFNYLGILQLFGNPQFMSNSCRNPKKLCEEVEKILHEPLLPGAEVHAKLAQKFFAQLRFYSEQATEDKLEEVVRRDMKARSVASDEIFFPKLHEAVERWWKRTGDVPFLTRSCELYEIAANQVELEKMHENSLSRVKIGEVRFDVNATARAEWVDLFESQTFVNIFSSTPELSCIRVIQYLQSQSADFKFVIVDNTKLNYKLGSLLSAQPDCLIIAYLPEVDNKIFDRIREATKKSIVVTKLKQEGDWASTSDETRGWMDLETSSREKVLETTVSFQGNSIPLGSLLDRAPRNLIDAETLHRIIYSETLFISNNIFSMDFEEFRGWYVNRDVLDVRSEKLVPIANIPTKNVFIAAEPGMGKSTLLTGHAMELKESDPLKWVIRMNLLDWSKKFNEWSEAELTLTEEHAFNLLLEITCYESGQIGSFERKIFEWYCKQRRIVLLIDAVDEISPNYTATVLQLIQLYKQNFTGKLRVTTRFGGVVKELEKGRNFVQYSLEPFSKVQSKLFLRRFWETKLGSRFNAEKFESYFIQLLTHLLEKSDVGKDDLVSIPLQFRMVAMIFQEHFANYCKSSEVQAQFEKLDLVTLYENFIELQFKVILLEDKNKTDTSKPYHANQLKENIRKIQNTHQLAAVFALFEYLKLNDIFSDVEMENFGEFIQKIKDSHENTGIITKMVFRRPVFVHRTYAEFFAAQFVWEKYALCQNEGLDLFYKFMFYIIEYDFSQVAKFLQQMAQQKIHDCFDVSSKAIDLLAKLMGILDGSVKKISSRAFSSLLGIVEHSLAWDGECLLKVKEVVRGKSEDFRDILLIEATESGYLELVRLLIDESPHKINASFDQIEGRTASHIEAAYTSKFIYTKNKSTNEKIINSFRFSLLHRAAKQGSTKVVSFLLESGAAIDDVTKLNETPLYLACTAGHLGVVQILLNFGANANISTLEMLTPLHIAARHGHMNVVRALLDVNTSDLDTCSDTGEVPLHPAIARKFSEIVELLLEKGANVNFATNAEGWTLLHFAVHQNLYQIADMLLARGANIASVTLEREETALHMAVNGQNLEMVQLLISKGADVNTHDMCGRTALNYAVKNKSVEIVNLLLDSGATLHEYDRGWSPLHEAASVGSLDLVKLFLSKGIDINLQARHGVTPLMMACFSRQTNLVKLMVDKGANVLLGTHGDAFMPMHCAAEKNGPEMIRLFVKKGAPINCVTKGLGYTPLQAAIRCKAAKAVDLLLSLGADRNLGSMYGYTTADMGRIYMMRDI